MKRISSSVPALGLLWLCSPVNASLVAQQATGAARVIDVAPRAKVRAVFSLSAEPLFDVGGLPNSPEDEFDHENNLLRAVMLSDGGIAVIDQVKVRLFDAAGKQRSVVGTSGQGRDDFVELNAHCRTRGDTVLVHDQRARVTVISPSGTIVRRIPDGANGKLLRNGCFDNGTMLLQRPGSGVTQPPTVLLNVVATDGKSVQFVGEAPAKSPTDMLRAPVNVFAQGAFIVVADSRTNEIRRLGDPERAVTFRLSDAVEKAPGRDPPASVYANGTLQRETGYAWPAYDEVLPGANGLLWIQNYKKHDSNDPDIWVQMDSRGRLVGKLIMPTPPRPLPRLQVEEFTKDGVLVYYMKADGTPHFLLFRLTLSATK